MPPKKNDTNKPDPMGSLEASVIGFQERINSEVHRDELLTTVATLETVGMSLIANDAKRIGRVAELLSQAFSTLSTSVVEPPFTEDQSTMLRAKYTTYAQMKDTPKKVSSGDQLKPTDTGAIPTTKTKQ
jgi:hypothetical protein